MNSTNQPNHEPGTIVPGTIGDVIRAWGTTPDEWPLLGPTTYTDSESIRFRLRSDGVTWDLERFDESSNEWYPAIDGGLLATSVDLTVPGTEGTDGGPSGYPTLRIELPANDQPVSSTIEIVVPLDCSRDDATRLRDDLSTTFPQSEILVRWDDAVTMWSTYGDDAPTHEAIEVVVDRWRRLMQEADGTTDEQASLVALRAILSTEEHRTMRSELQRLYGRLRRMTNPHRYSDISVAWSEPGANLIEQDYHDLQQQYADSVNEACRRAGIPEYIRRR